MAATAPSTPTTGMSTSLGYETASPLPSLSVFVAEDSARTGTSVSSVSGPFEAFNRLAVPSWNASSSTAVPSLLTTSSWSMPCRSRNRSKLGSKRPVVGRNDCPVLFSESVTWSSLNRKPTPSSAAMALRLAVASKSSKSDWSWRTTAPPSATNDDRSPSS